MSAKEQDKFETWCNTVHQGTFDFKKEVKVYCENDTDILTTACTIFRNEYIEELRINPIRRAIVALDRIYRVTQFSEVWHFERNIFIEYIHTFLQGKQEDSVITRLSHTG